MLNDTTPRSPLVADSSELQELYRLAMKELTADPHRITSFDSQGILSVIPVGFAVAHGDTGRLLFVNNAYAAALGYSPAELEWNFRWFDLVLDSDKPSVRQEIENQLDVYRSFGAADVKTRRQWRHKDGHAVEGTVRYFGAWTNDIRGNPMPLEADVKTSPGLPVVIAMAEFDHFATKRGVQEANRQVPHIDVDGHYGADI